MWVRRAVVVAAAAVVLSLMVLPAGLGARGVKPATFESPGQGVKALIDALKADDLARVRALFGSDADDILSSGDEVADRATRDSFLAAYGEKNSLGEEKDGQVTLLLGADEWPFPIPIVREGKGWRFDAEAGREEILNRRIGKNELETIETCRGYVDAQREYAMRDWDGNGLNEYARKFRSTEGAKDGLFWETRDGEEPSPMGPFAAKAADEGYLKGNDTQPAPYHGYCYRILAGQGKNARGGAYDYVVKDRMVGGFALVAYPAEYGNSGVMTFVVNHDGVVYQKDLGERTEKTAKSMELFDPDPSWNKVD